MVRASPLNNSRAERVLERLHAEADSQQRSIILKNFGQLPSLLMGKGVRFQQGAARFYDDKYIAIDKNQGRLLYLLARATGARNIVEFGTSFGISTIYLACAVRDNGGGKVITSELVERKAKQAHANIQEAGVDQYVDIKEGDARETLKEVSKQIDLALIDGFPTLALDVLKVIEARLRPGALVLVDDVNLFKQDLLPMIQYCQDPANGYRGTTLALGDGFSLSIRL